MERDYWEYRYASGGSSGIGSIGKNREWKWQVITSFLPQIGQVIDVGCGDLSFWESRFCPNYIGIDISESIITKNRRNKPDWTFILSSADQLIQGLQSPCVFCNDLLFHIMDSDKFINTLNNLCSYSTEYIFIATWVENPFTPIFRINSLISTLRTFKIRKAFEALKTLLSETTFTDGKYQYFRLLEHYCHIFSNHGFKLIQKKKNPFNSKNGMYVFRRTDI